MKRWGRFVAATLAFAAIFVLTVGIPPAQAGETYKLKIANWYVRCASSSRTRVFEHAIAST